MRLLCFVNKSNLDNLYMKKKYNYYYKGIYSVKNGIIYIMIQLIMHIKMII